MLRYDRQTKPGLVALYDIRPGNGAGPFLQPRSPHGAPTFGNDMRVALLDVGTRNCWNCNKDCILCRPSWQPVFLLWQHVTANITVYQLGDIHSLIVQTIQMILW